MMVHSASLHTQPRSAKTVADLPAHEAQCLNALAESYSENGPSYATFAFVMRETGLDRTQVKRAVRRLARRGYALFGKGLWTEDGEPFGSGYCCTHAGYAASGAEERDAEWLASMLARTTPSDTQVGTSRKASEPIPSGPDGR